MDSFEISDNSLPNEMLEYYRQHPDINIDCVWNIVMPADSKVRYLAWDLLSSLSIYYLT